MNESEQQKQKGLYTPTLEKDSCGVGFIADLSGEASNYVLDTAITMLENMEHRGACGCEENTGDGAGILTQLPHGFFKKELEKEGVTLSDIGKYGVAMIFLPKDEDKQQYCFEVIHKYTRQHDFKIFHTRKVPVNNSGLGETALESEPEIFQLFFKTDSFNNKAIESRFYFLRHEILKEIYFSGDLSLRDDFYIASLSSKTIVYKGLLRAIQLRSYYKDLLDRKFATAIAIIHSRFSTNTVPKWKLAQPFRCIAHNGEINTIQGNINWWNAREKNMERRARADNKLINVFPVCDPFTSDSGNFDNVVDFLLTASRSIPHTIMMMIPEAWQNNHQLAAHKKAFYEYHDAVLEPWDGPASICFTDGTIVGATLDRNGLRPSRYVMTSDNLLILASEAGVIDLDESKIIKKGKLKPGKMLVADIEEKRIITDKELKETICKRKDYTGWLANNAQHISDLPVSPVLIPNSDGKNYLGKNLKQKQIAFGFTLEDEALIVNAMTSNAKEPVGSMGADIPLAVLSKIAQHPANYFKQQFAQVTNPPIDSLREKYYMSLSTAIGGGSKIVNIGETEAKTIRFDSPLLTEQQLANLINNDLEEFQVAKFELLYDKKDPLEIAIDAICIQVELEIDKGKKLIYLTDSGLNADQLAIPSLLLIGALHHFLIEIGLRKEVSLVLEVGDVWETHHFATLLSFGADLVCPYIALQTAAHLAKKNNIEATEAIKNYIKAVDKGLLKIISKLGVSTLASYKGAQTFEALGISEEVVNKCFKGTITRIGGMRFTDFKKENEVKHKLAFDVGYDKLPDTGTYQWKQRGEYHLFNPQSIHLLQHATRTNNYETYKKFSAVINDLDHNNSTLRSFINIKNNGKKISLSSVEPAENILKRFVTGAMSFGSISEEAHSTLAIAMNRIGGKSNSGEGGEDESRYPKMENGDWKRSAIKQVASGRFGVDINYLTNAEELQIKIAQGAKPGEGGQLPGHKVDKNIARVRNSTPGVGLISPPPHHDIYSIEDLAQLIFDLKNANRSARVSVKLVAKTGVGVIASGVTKAHADHILISGFDGGTGASPLSSIRHAGLPWELGLSETHQTLVKNGLRDRVVLQTDGQIRTARDMAIATMLGAEEWGIATGALVVEGCILMRKCHLNTCPVGIATQNETLRKKYTGKPEHVVNYFHFLAEELRALMAELGIKTINELVGRADLLEIVKLENHWKTENLNLNPILYREDNKYNNTMFCSTKQNHNLEQVLDRRLMALTDFIGKTTTYKGIIPIKSTDRTVGAMLSNELTKIYGNKEVEDDSIQFKFKGVAGQSFGAFLAKGITFDLEGAANDYTGKGLSGGKLIIKPDRDNEFKSHENVIIGNVAMYGATNGEAYISGIAGDRFCVRNSGVKAVIEGIGHNGCEYMTGGVVVILGRKGNNFAAGMSGGIAFLYDAEKKDLHNTHNVNTEMVLLETPHKNDLTLLKTLIKNHHKYTGSKIAQHILENWKTEQKNFSKVMPEEYKLALEKQQLIKTKAS